MKPEVHIAPEINLEPFLARHLEQLLRACGFDIRSSSECSDFLRTLNNFGRFICERYSTEIAQQLSNPRNDMTRDELVSWTISELRALQAVTFQKFGVLITNSEAMKLGVQSIDCRTAANHTYRLSEIYQAAASEWKRSHDYEPSSKKHRDKRRNRKWAPYLVEILFRPQD